MGEKLRQGIRQYLDQLRAGPSSQEYQKSLGWNEGQIKRLQANDSLPLFIEAAEELSASFSDATVTIPKPEEMDEPIHLRLSWGAHLVRGVIEWNEIAFGIVPDYDLNPYYLRLYWGNGRSETFIPENLREKYKPELERYVLEAILNPKVRSTALGDKNPFKTRTRTVHFPLNNSNRAAA
ncbi:MAG: hypothetical protein AAB801_00920 [Patescibacteria group bacterium]